MELTDEKEYKSVQFALELDPIETEMFVWYALERIRYDIPALVEYAVNSILRNKIQEEEIKRVTKKKIKSKKKKQIVKSKISKKPLKKRSTRNLTGS